MKISILYVSKTGNTEAIAKVIEEGIKEKGNFEIKLMNIINEGEIDYKFIEESKSVVIGTPTYYANLSWQVKNWIDESKCNLEGKLGACFATENVLGGGADIALLNLVGAMLTKGMIVYSGGAALDKPYTHLGAVCIKEGNEEQKTRAKIFGNRIANKALQLFK